MTETRARTRTMKTILIICILWSAQYCRAEEDCKPRSQFEIPGTSSSTYEFQAYTKEEPLTLYIIFQHLNEYLTNDRLVLSNESNVYQLRDGRLRSSPLNINLPMDGWHSFTLSVNGFSLHIDNFTKILDYPIETMIVIGNNLTLCSEGTPMWHIYDRQPAIIPVLNSKHFGTQLKLFSHTEFEPDIEVTEQWTFYNHKIVKRSNSNAVTMSKNQDYMIIIFENKILIQDKDGFNIMMKQLLKRPSEISVSSLMGEFNITLLLNHPYPEPKQDFQTPETQIEMLSSISMDTHNSQSTGIIVMAAITAVSLTICLAAVITIMRAKNKRCKHNGHGQKTAQKELSEDEFEALA